MYNLINRSLDVKQVCRLLSCSATRLILLQAIINFLLLADASSQVPPLTKGFKYADYALSEEEWELLELLHEVLQVHANVLLYVITLTHYLLQSRNRMMRSSHSRARNTLPSGG